MYVIHKTSRAPSNVSYAGVTWDKINMRHLYREQYKDCIEAMIYANLLSTANPIGFKVSLIATDGSFINVDI